MNLLIDGATIDSLIKMGFYFGIACLVIFPLMMMAYISYAKKQDHVPFHYRNCFPYEAFVDKERSQDKLARVLQALVLIATLVPSVFSLSAFVNAKTDTNFNIYNSFFLVLSLLAAVGFVLISIIPLKNPRIHLILYFVYLATMILKKTVGGVTLLQLSAQYVSEAAKILGIVVLITLLVEIILLVNPKLKTWDKLERVTNEKGEEVLRRPKWFVLAYSEWAVFGVGLIADIIMTVGVYLVKVAANS